jgi:hypothetical protein
VSIETLRHPSDRTAYMLGHDLYFKFSPKSTCLIRSRKVNRTEGSVVLVGLSQYTWRSILYPGRRYTCWLQVDLVPNMHRTLRYLEPISFSGLMS